MGHTAWVKEVGLIALKLYGNLSTGTYLHMNIIFLSPFTHCERVAEIFIPLTSEHHHAYGKALFNVGVRSHVAEADGNQASKGKVDGCAIAGLQNHVVG